MSKEKAKEWALNKIGYRSGNKCCAICRSYEPYQERYYSSNDKHRGEGTCSKFGLPISDTNKQLDKLYVRSEGVCDAFTYRSKKGLKALEISKNIFETYHFPYVWSKDTDERRLLGILLKKLNPRDIVAFRFRDTTEESATEEMEDFVKTYLSELDKKVSDSKDELSKTRKEVRKEKETLRRHSVNIQREFNISKSKILRSIDLAISEELDGMEDRLNNGN